MSDPIGLDVSIRFFKVVSSPYFSSLDRWSSSCFSIKMNSNPRMEEVALPHLSFSTDHFSSLLTESQCNSYEATAFLCNQLELSDYITDFNSIPSAQIKRISQSTPSFVIPLLPVVWKLGRIRWVLHLVGTNKENGETVGRLKEKEDSLLYHFVQSLNAFINENVDKNKEKHTQNEETNALSYHFGALFHSHLSFLLHNLLSLVSFPVLFDTLFLILTKFTSISMFPFDFMSSNV